MAKITKNLSSKVDKSTRMSEILLRFRKGDDIAQRGHSHIFIKPQFFRNGEVYISAKSVITDEVRLAYQSKTKLDDLCNHIMTTFQNMALSEIIDGWLQREIDRFMFPEQVKREEKTYISFFDAMEKYLEMHQDLSKSRINHIRVLIRTLHRYEFYSGNFLELDKITPEILCDYKNFFQYEHSLFKENKDGEMVPVAKYKSTYQMLPEERTPAERGENYVKNMFKMLRAFMNWAVAQGLTNNNPFPKFKIGSEVYGKPYCLTREERDIIYRTDLSSTPRLAIQRDIFIFQCYIGCRVSDLYSLCKNNIIENETGVAVQYIADKTIKENPVVTKVYLQPVAREILNRYRDYSERKLFPLISQQKYNKAIKEVLHACGITKMVTIVNPTTGKSEMRCIADVASSHLARRTFITNLFREIKDPVLVGKLSNHKEGSSAINRYIDRDDELVREISKLI